MKRDRSLRMAALAIIPLALCITAATWRSGAAPAGHAEAIRTTETCLAIQRPAARRALGDYTRTGGLFGQSPAPAPASKLPAPTTPPKPKAAPRPAPQDPLSGYAFTGLITVDGQTYAMIQDRATGKGEYVAVGDDFMGYRVTAIDHSGVTLSAGPEPRTLAMNDRYSLVPLSKDSAAGSASPQPQPMTAVPGPSGSSLSYPYINTVGLSLHIRTGRGSEADVQAANNDYFAGKITEEELRLRENRSGSQVSVLMGATYY